MKSTIRRFLANNRTAAEAVARTTGLFTKAVRQANVAMFHPGRCGSTVVGMLLNQHPKVKWAGEIFAQIKSKYGKESWVWERPYEMIKLRTNIYVSKVFGIEIKKKHFNDVKMTKKEIIKLFNKMEYDKFIVLERKNYLSRRVSSIVGDKIGTWNTDETVNPPKVYVPTKHGDGSTIIDDFEDNDKFFEDINEILKEKDILNISYEEDIRDDPKKAFNKIIKYIGIKRVNVKVETKKINNRPISDRISNFEQVSDCLRGTKYEWMVRQV